MVVVPSASVAPKTSAARCRRSRRHERDSLAAVRVDRVPRDPVARRALAVDFDAVVAVLARWCCRGRRNCRCKPRIRTPSAALPTPSVGVRGTPTKLDVTVVPVLPEASTMPAPEPARTFPRSGFAGPWGPTFAPITVPVVPKTATPAKPPAGFARGSIPMTFPETRFPAPALATSTPRSSKSQIALPAPAGKEPPMTLFVAPTPVRKTPSWTLWMKLPSMPIARRRGSGWRPRRSV